MAEQGLTQWDIANHVAKRLKRPTFTQGTVQSALSGRTRPPLDAIEAWADALGLEKSKRTQWLKMAIREHLPTPLRDLV